MTEDDFETTWSEDEQGPYAVEFSSAEIAALDGALLLVGELSKSCQKEIVLPWGRQLQDRDAALEIISSTKERINAKMQNSLLPRDRLLLDEMLTQLVVFV